MARRPAARITASAAAVPPLFAPSLISARPPPSRHRDLRRGAHQVSSAALFMTADRRSRSEASLNPRRHALTPGRGSPGAGKTGSPAIPTLITRAVHVGDESGQIATHIRAYRMSSANASAFARSRSQLASSQAPSRRGHEQRRPLLLDAVPPRQIAQVGGVVVAVRPVGDQSV